MKIKASKQRKRVRRKNCVFCGKAEVTKEHIFGRQIARIWKNYDKDRKCNYHKINTDIKNGQITHEDGWRATQNGTLYSSYSCCCEACNSGWMKKIQSEAAPIIEDYSKKGKIAFTPKDLKILAKYGYLKSLVVMTESLDLTGFENPGFPDAQELMQEAANTAAISFKDQQEIPKHFSIYFARRHGNPFAYEENPGHGYRFEPGGAVITNGKILLSHFFALHLPRLSIVLCGYPAQIELQHQMLAGQIYGLAQNNFIFDFGKLPYLNADQLNEMGLFGLDRLQILIGSDRRAPRFP